MAVLCELEKVQKIQMLRLWITVFKEIVSVLDKEWPV